MPFHVCASPLSCWLYVPLASGCAVACLVQGRFPQMEPFTTVDSVTRTGLVSVFLLQRLGTIFLQVPSARWSRVIASFMFNSLNIVSRMTLGSFGMSATVLGRWLITWRGPLLNVYHRPEIEVKKVSARSEVPVICPITSFW